MSNPVLGSEHRRTRWKFSKKIDMPALARQSGAASGQQFRENEVWQRRERMWETFGRDCFFMTYQVISSGRGGSSFCAA